MKNCVDINGIMCFNVKCQENLYIIVNNIYNKLNSRSSLLVGLINKRKTDIHIIIV
ncbi:hypothetical protein [Clostridium sp. DJ247]|uniref:hypothetical protein n=1 Tax=Clostridium sp. DJ247 TaxID=2726188 RepID=UPI00162818DB|nr:hypothetical protein [Clostridium sp. DJ247]